MLIPEGNSFYCASFFTLALRGGNQSQGKKWKVMKSQQGCSARLELQSPAFVTGKQLLSSCLAGFSALLKIIQGLHITVFFSALPTPLKITEAPWDVLSHICSF